MNKKLITQIIKIIILVIFKGYPSNPTTPGNINSNVRNSNADGNTGGSGPNTNVDVNSAASWRNSSVDGNVGCSWRNSNEDANTSGSWRNSNSDSNTSGSWRNSNSDSNTSGSWRNSNSDSNTSGSWRSSNSDSNTSGSWRNTHTLNGRGGINSNEHNRDRRGPNKNIAGPNRNNGGSNVHNSNSRPGDWSCKNCGANNFSHRADCFKCSNLKDGSRNKSYLRGNVHLSPISEEIKLIKLLEKKKSDVRTIEQNTQIYIKAWKHCRQLSHLQLETLLVSMAKLPSSFIFNVPPLASHCKMAAECFINFEVKNKTEIGFKEAVLPKVEIIVNFVKVCMAVRRFHDVSLL